MKISFLGGGNMAQALIGGMVQQGVTGRDIQVVELYAELRDKLTQQFAVRAVEAVDDALLDCDVLVLAVKPQQMREALAPMAGKLNTNTLVVSIAAGLRVADLSRWLGGHAAIVRAMPNTPALVGAGITGLFAADAVSDEQREAAEQVICAVGDVVWVCEESEIDAITAISGSGPAYVFYFIEVLQQAAEKLGFSPETAKALAIGTAQGAAKLAASSDDEPAVLRQKVTSKGGTTAAALDVLFASGWDTSMLKAAQAAQARGQELGEILGQD